MNRADWYTILGFLGLIALIALMVAVGCAYGPDSKGLYPAPPEKKVLTHSGDLWPAPTGKENLTVAGKLVAVSKQESALLWACVIGAVCLFGFGVFVQVSLREVLGSKTGLGICAAAAAVGTIFYTMATLHLWLRIGILSFLALGATCAVIYAVRKLKASNSDLTKGVKSLTDGIQAAKCDLGAKSTVLTNALQIHQEAAGTRNLINRLRGKSPAKEK